MKPAPRDGVDRLADRTQPSQGLALAGLKPVIALAHHCTQCRRRRIEILNLKTIYDFPAPACIGPDWRSFEDYGGGTVEQRSINAIAVARNPANVGGAPMDTPGAQVKNERTRPRCLHGISASAVHDAFWRTR
jgi:hypothetical protein